MIDDTLDESLLNDEDDIDCEVNSKEENELLEDYDLQNLDDPDEDVLELNLDSDLISENDISTNEEKPSTTNNDIEKKSGNDKPNLFNQKRRRQNVKGKVQSNYNNSSKKFMRRGKTVLINPSFKGPVHVNSRQYIWEKPQEYINPWINGNYPQSSNLNNPFLPNHFNVSMPSMLQSQVFQNSTYQPPPLLQCPNPTFQPSQPPPLLQCPIYQPFINQQFPGPLDQTTQNHTPRVIYGLRPQRKFHRNLKNPKAFRKNNQNYRNPTEKRIEEAKQIETVTTQNIKNESEVGNDVDEETRVYLSKIEEQKKQREELLKKKEENRIKKFREQTMKDKLNGRKMTTRTNVYSNNIIITGNDQSNTGAPQSERIVKYSESPHSLNFENSINLSSVSSFLNDRIVIGGNNLTNTNIVVVKNLASTTSEPKIMSLCQNIGKVQVRKFLH